MNTTTKSPRRVLAFAYLIGLATFRDYAHKFSPKKFTQPQLFACLVLKEFLLLNYRKLAALLKDCSELAATIDMRTAPHFTTFQKAADRLLTAGDVRTLLAKTLDVARDQGRLKPQSDLAALDGTGFEAHHVSHYCANNGKTQHDTTYRRFPKAGVLCECKSHLILSITPGRGPAPDVPHFRAALDDALLRQPITTPSTCTRTREKNAA